VTQGQQGVAGAPGLSVPAAAAPPLLPGEQQQQPAAAATEGQGDGLILTDLLPDALALVYDCLPSKEDRRNLMHSCRVIHSLPQLRAKVGRVGIDDVQGCNAEVQRQAPHAAAPSTSHTVASALCVLQVHKTTLHMNGGLKELTFFPR